MEELSLCNSAPKSSVVAWRTFLHNREQWHLKSFPHALKLQKEKNPCGGRKYDKLPLGLLQSFHKSDSGSNYWSMKDTCRDNPDYFCSIKMQSAKSLFKPLLIFRFFKDRMGHKLLLPLHVIVEITIMPNKISKSQELKFEVVVLLWCLSLQSTFSRHKGTCLTGWSGSIPAIYMSFSRQCSDVRAGSWPAIACFEVVAY